MQATVLLALLLLSTPPLPTHSAPAVCNLVAGLPGASHPLWRSGSVGKLVVRLSRGTGGGPGHSRRMGGAYRKLRERVNRGLENGQKVFSPANKARWGDARRQKARAFLSRWALGPEAVLQVGRFGLEPTPPITALLLRGACLAGRAGEAIAWGRASTGTEGRPHRAFAALLLLSSGQREAAVALLEGSESGDFLSLYVGAELEPDTERRGDLHQRARRRAESGAQAAAVDAQARRFGIPLGTP